MTKRSGNVSDLVNLTLVRSRGRIRGVLLGHALVLHLFNKQEGCMRNIVMAAVAALYLIGAGSLVHADDVLKNEL